MKKSLFFNFSFAVFLIHIFPAIASIVFIGNDQEINSFKCSFAKMKTTQYPQSCCQKLAVGSYILFFRCHEEEEEAEEKERFPSKSTYYLYLQWPVRFHLVTFSTLCWSLLMLLFTIRHGNSISTILIEKSFS